MHRIILSMHIHSSLRWSSPVCCVLSFSMLSGHWQVESEDIVTLDHRLTTLFNGAMLLLADFLLLNNGDSENTNKIRRAYSTTDGWLFLVSCQTVFSFIRKLSPLHFLAALCAVLSSLCDLCKSFCLLLEESATLAIFQVCGCCRLTDGIKGAISLPSRVQWWTKKGWGQVTG